MKTAFWCAVAMSAAAVLPGATVAQTYPDRPINITIGFPAGGGYEVVLRPVAVEMEKRLGQPVVIQNRPGASGTIGAKFVVNSKPDGYNLMGGGLESASVLLNKNNGVDAAKELAPITHFTTQSWYVLVSTRLPVTNLQELVAYTKANPKAVRTGVAGASTVLAMEMVRGRTGMVTDFIPYAASPQQHTALLAGDVDVVIGIPNPYLPYIKSGKLRPLFVAADKRSSIVPEAPTAAEVGYPDLIIGNQNGLWAPLGTPQDIIQKLNVAALAIFKDPKFLEQIRTVGLEPVATTPEQGLRNFQAIMQFWADAAKRINYKPE